jgi:AraC-like DNA-binding protein
VNSGLSHIQNWSQLADHAGYSVSALAKSCNASVRTLQRFFLTAFGDTPSHWLKDLRMQKAVELLRDGSTIKETAARLGYEDPSHFSRDFKDRYGFAPARYANLPAKAAALPKMSHLAMKLSRLAMKS